jgi:hypothetical protein
MTNAPATTDDTCPDAIIAGTLCLMSSYAQHRAPSFAGRIADNLRRLASMPTRTAEFRAVCRRMAGRWIALRAEAVRLSGRGVAPPDTRLLQ